MRRATAAQCLRNPWLKITDDDVAEAQRTIDRVKRKDLAAGQDGHEEEREEVEDPSDQLEALSL